MRLILTTALFLVFSFIRVYAESISDSNTKSAEDLIRSYIQQHYKNEYATLSIHIGKYRRVLPDQCIIDIETGSGHGGVLYFYRLHLNGEDVTIEKVLLQSGTILVPDPKEKCKVQHAVTKRKNLNEILEAISILPSINLIEKQKINSIKNADGTSTISGGLWSSTADIFVLIRVHDSNREILIENEYAGYLESRSQLKYLPVSAVTDIAEARLEKIDSWKDLPSNQWRESHLSDAFNLNRDLLLEDFHWWVLEDSLEGLAQAGNLSVKETIHFILPKYKDRTKRIVNKIRTITSDFDYWLSGSPKILTLPK